MTSTLRIEIPRRSPVCAVDQEPLTPGKEYFSVLCEGEKGSLQRQDYCTTCWKSLPSQEHALSYWKSIVPSRKKQQQPVNRNERALELLRTAVASNTVDASAEAFVLALYLARNRHILARKDLSPDIALYEVAETEEMLAVRKVALSNLVVSAVQQQLAKKFASDYDSEHASLSE